MVYVIFFANVVTNIQLAEYYNKCAEIDIKKGKFAQAISEYNKAVEIENASAIPYYNRGCLYIKLAIQFGDQRFCQSH